MQVSSFIYMGSYPTILLFKYGTECLLEAKEKNSNVKGALLDHTAFVLSRTKRG